MDTKHMMLPDYQCSHMTSHETMLTLSVMVAEKSIVCLLTGQSLMISFIWSSKCSSNILKRKKTKALVIQANLTESAYLSASSSTKISTVLRLKEGAL